MAVELTPLGKAVFGSLKWVIAPLLAAYIGYAMIGPRVGGNIVKKLRKLPGIGGNLSNSNDSESQNEPSKNAKRFQEIRGIGD
jgi:hypothetical protein